MKRATICADVHQPGEVSMAEAWIQQNATLLTHVSDGGGCGCCVVMWDVEGPSAVVESLPSALACQSDWSTSLDES